MSPMRAFPFLFMVLIVLYNCGSSSDSGKIFVEESGHEQDWANPLFIGRDNFHGTVIKVPEPGPRGVSLFLLHCAACHGSDASGKIGPNIQGVPASSITAAITIVPLMQGHSILSQRDREDIAAYLAALEGNAVPVGATIKTGPCGECHGPGLEGGIARISCFSCHDGPGGGIGHPAGWVLSKEEPVLFHGRYGKDFVAACANCHGIGLKGGIGPPCSLCHDGNNAPLLGPFSLTRSSKERESRPSEGGSLVEENFLRACTSTRIKRSMRPTEV